MNRLAVGRLNENRHETAHSAILSYRPCPTDPCIPYSLHRTDEHSEGLPFVRARCRETGRHAHEKDFPGPPNYEDVKKGDKPEMYWLLQLQRAVCINEDPQQSDVNPAHQSVATVQLVVDPLTYKSDSKLLGKRVVATGKLFGAITGHHHTPVVLNVTTLAAR